MIPAPSRSARCQPFGSGCGSSGGPEIFVLVWSGVRVGSGGDEETRTPDPLLAKEMLFRLSYVPLRTILDDLLMVGVSGLEPETSALSGQCSNQLS